MSHESGKLLYLDTWDSLNSCSPRHTCTHAAITRVVIRLRLVGGTSCGKALPNSLHDISTTPGVCVFDIANAGLQCRYAIQQQ